MTKILTRHGEVGAIANLMNTTPRTVYSALNGVTNSDKAKQIRALAIKRGGAEEKAEQVTILK